MRRQRKKSFPTDVADVLSVLLNKRKYKKKIEDCKVITLWEDVVGDQIAKRTEPMTIRKGVLNVTVSDHGWLQELQFLKEDIRTKLNEAAGKELVKNLYFRVGEIHEKEVADNPVAEEMKKVKLTKEERSDIEALVSGIGEKSIRDAMKRTMIKEAKRKKLESSSG